MTAAILAASPSCIMCRHRHTTAMAKVISLSAIPISLGYRPAIKNTKLPQLGQA